MDKEMRKKTIVEGVIYLVAVTIIAAALILSVRILRKQEVEETIPAQEEVVIYTGSVDGPSPYGGDLEVTVYCSPDGTILAVEVGENNATEGIGTIALDALPEAIVAAQGTNVEMVSGASITSEALISAVNEALAMLDAQ